MSGKITRLALLGVPAGFHPAIAARQAPRFHTLVHLAIVLASLAIAVTAMVVWSRYVAAAAHDAAKSRHALLYDSDIGAESLGLIFTALFLAGWLCRTITWRRGDESARSGWAADLLHEPAKNKAITDWLWQTMIRRHTRLATSAEDFLDRLGAGVVRDLRLAALVMFALTIILGALVPARISFATDTAITDRPVLPLARDRVSPLSSAKAVISGCPTLPKDGNTLVYRLHIAGAEANLGSWKPLVGSQLAALEAIAGRLPAGTKRERFSNPIRSDPLSLECLEAFGRQAGADGLSRLLTLLSVSDTERKGRF